MTRPLIASKYCILCIERYLQILTEIEQKWAEKERDRDKTDGKRFIWNEREIEKEKVLLREVK